MVLMIAMTKRRSLAVGWRLAIMRTQASSIATSIMFTLSSPLMTCCANSASWLCIAVMASVSCCSTSPPIANTCVRMCSSSALNWPEICLFKFRLSIFLTSTVTASDVVFSLFTRWRSEQRVGVAVFDQLTQIHEGGAVRTTRSLLHVVGHDNHCVIRFQLGDQLFDTPGRDRVQR